MHAMSWYINLCIFVIMNYSLQCTVLTVSTFFMPCIRQQNIIYNIIGQRDSWSLNIYGRLYLIIYIENIDILLAPLLVIVWYRHLMSQKQSSRRLRLQKWSGGHLMSQKQSGGHFMSQKWSGRHLMSQKQSGGHLMSQKQSGGHLMSEKCSGRHLMSHVMFSIYIHF